MVFPMSFNIPPITDYLRLLDTNLAEAQSSSVILPMVEEIDRFYRCEVFVSLEEVNPLSAQLCLNAHMLLLATARQALSGHPGSVFPLARTALESACYAFLIMNDDRLGEIWLQRNESASKLSKCRKAFGKAAADVASRIRKDVEEVGNLVSDLYQNLIEFGAHPNSKSVVDYLHFKEENENGMMPVVLGGIYAVDDSLTLRGGFAYIETALITALVICGALGKDHPLLQAESTRFPEMFALKGKLFDDINKT